MSTCRKKYSANEFYTQLIDDHRVGRSLVLAGYKYVHLGNNYGRRYGPTRTQPATCLPRSLPSEFADIFYYMTPLSRIISPQDKYAFVKEKFRRVREADGEGAPLFVYAHFLVPHHPYVFAGDGSRLPEWEVANLESKKNYIGQLQAANRMILETIDAILNKPGNDPIIVLTADEGPYLKQVDESLPSPRTDASIEPASSRQCVCRRMTTPSKISESITPVNIFRFLFDRYFGTQLGLLPDRTFFWEKAGTARPSRQRTIASFIDVTKAIQE